MKTRKSNSYMKTGMYLLIGALAGGVLGAGAYMILSSWGQGFEGLHSAGSGSTACPVRAGRRDHLQKDERNRSSASGGGG